jgi:molybdopterin converting factor small subunit
MVTLQFDSRLLVMPLSEEIPVQKIGGHDIRIQVLAGKSVNQTFKDLNIQLSQAVTAIVNGQATDLEKPLETGDLVRLLPQIAGGD